MKVEGHSHMNQKFLAISLIFMVGWNIARIISREIHKSRGGRP